MILERVIGAILGGAIGDGWGRQFEGGLSRGAAHVPEEFLITDDTQLTLATCEAVIEYRRVDPEEVAARFLVWYRSGRLSGMGASTLKALRDLDSGAHWALSGARGERAAGNGAAMRVAPLAFLLDPGEAGGRQTLRDVCRITHHHDEAYIGALAVITAIRLSTRTSRKPARLIVDVASRLPDSQVRDRLLQFAKVGEEITPLQVADEWGNSGFVADSVPLAIFAARDLHRHTFPEILQRAIDAGGDTDTIGSITGQIAGAALGVSAIPNELLLRLRDRAEITATAEKFARVAAESYDGEWNE